MHYNRWEGGFDANFELGESERREGCSGARYSFATKLENEGKQMHCRRYSLLVLQVSWMHRAHTVEHNARYNA